MKCAMPRLSPRKTDPIASPSVTAGHGPARTKSSHVVGVATNVFVSCMKPPTAMRMDRPPAPCLARLELMASNSIQTAGRRRCSITPRLGAGALTRSRERHGSMRHDRIEVRPVAGALCAEILNIDLAHDLGEETIGALRRAWLEHLVVFFRDQTLEPERFLQLARRFGEVIEYPFVKGIEGFPEITPVIQRENEKMNFGGLWHSDTAYLDQPPMATMLIAREVPSFGGDTLFANMYLAYETLSEGMRRMLDGLVAVNSSAKADVTRTREDRVRDGAKQDAKQQYAAEHPVVRTHPETGRKALYVNFGYSVCFKHRTEEKSPRILHYLLQHTARPKFTCRFRWQVGSVALWDNRCTQHNPVNDYHGFRRGMHRVTLAGDRPR